MPRFDKYGWLYEIQNRRLVNIIICTPKLAFIEHKLFLLKKRVFYKRGCVVPPADSHRPDFSSRPVRVGFRVDRLTEGLVYFRVRLISSDSNIPSMLHNYSSNTDAI